MSATSRPQYDTSAGKYRILGFHEGVIQPGVEQGVPAAFEWYEKRIASRRRIRSRVVGKKHPRLVTEDEEAHLTVGLVLGGVGLLLAWEASAMLAHGLAGLDPLSWTTDIADWIEGKQPASDSVTTTTVGGFLTAEVMTFLAPQSGASSAGGSSSGAGSPGSGLTVPPVTAGAGGSGGSGVGGTPPVTFPVPPVEVPPPYVLPPV